MASSGLFYALVFYIIKDYCVYAANLTVPDVTPVVDRGILKLNCTYQLAPSETFKQFSWRRSSDLLFEAPYFEGSTFNPNGSFYAGFTSRGSTQYYNGQTSSDLSISLAQITVADEGAYSCNVVLGDGSTNTASTTVVVDFSPTTPTITGSPGSVLGGAGQTDITCTANLGKPDGTLQWYRIQNGITTSIVANSTSLSNNTDGTKNAVSVISLVLDTADNGVKFKCEVSNRADTKSTESSPITITDPVPVADNNIQLCRTVEGEKTFCGEQTAVLYYNDRVTLFCQVLSSSTAPNPQAKYMWYDVASNGERSKNAAFVLVISPDNVGDYACNVTNTVRGVTYTITKQITLRASVKPTTKTSTTVPTPQKTTKLSPGPTGETKPTVPAAPLGAGAIAGIAIAAVVIVIVVIVAIVCILRRRSSGKGEKKYDAEDKTDHGQKSNNAMDMDEGYNTQPDVVTSDQLYAQSNKPRAGDVDDPRRHNNVEGLVYADLALDDTPRSRKPIQAYELTGTEYAEIMRK